MSFSARRLCTASCAHSCAPSSTCCPESATRDGGPGDSGGAVLGHGRGNDALLPATDARDSRKYTGPKLDAEARSPLRTLGRLVSSTGYVVKPYLQYPDLLPHSLRTARGWQPTVVAPDGDSSHGWSARRPRPIPLRPFADVQREPPDVDASTWSHGRSAERRCAIGGRSGVGRCACVVILAAVLFSRRHWGSVP